jgi:hypothetical protein
MHIYAVLNIGFVNEACCVGAFASRFCAYLRSIEQLIRFVNWACWAFLKPGRPMSARGCPEAHFDYFCFQIDRCFPGGHLEDLWRLILGCSGFWGNIGRPGFRNAQQAQFTNRISCSILRRYAQNLLANAPTQQASFTNPMFNTA